MPWSCSTNAWMTIFVGLNMVASERPMLFRLVFVVTGLSVRPTPPRARPNPTSRFRPDFDGSTDRAGIALIAKAFDGSPLRSRCQRQAIASGFQNQESPGLRSNLQSAPVVPDLTSAALIKLNSGVRLLGRAKQLSLRAPA